MQNQYLQEWQYGLNVVSKLNGKEKVVFPKETMIGALAEYISSENVNFQPMNANFGIFPSLEVKIEDKKLRYEALAKRALEKIAY